MDTDILLILVQDGVVNGALYALLALALVLIFTVTRVVFVPIGDLVSYGALTLASLEAGRVPGTLGLLVGLGLASTLVSLWAARRELSGAKAARMLAEGVLLPAAVAAAVLAAPLARSGQVTRVALAVLVVAPLGPYLFNVVYRPIARATVLLLLVVSVALHLALVGFGLLAFGAGGAGTAPLSDASLALGGLVVGGQAMAVVGVTAAAALGLYGFSVGTFQGKALRATAVNRLGAQLVGISPLRSGKLAFLLAAATAALAGALVSALTTIYYDTGFLIALKGFVAGIVGGLVSYPVAAAAAVAVGLIEAFSSFYASAFKEVIVFLIIIPVLLWRSLAAPAMEDED